MTNRQFLGLALLLVVCFLMGQGAAMWPASQVSVSGLVSTTLQDAIDGLELGGSVSELGDVGDVTIASPLSNEYLHWNGSAWVNDHIDAADLANIASGFVADGQALVWNGSTEYVAGHAINQVIVLYPTTTPTTAGRIEYNAATDCIEVGDGSATDEFCPTTDN